jgi:uncharacterized protein (DUF58 family)
MRDSILPPLGKLIRRSVPRPRRGPLRLTRRHIYLLPTRHGLAFAGTLLVMLLGALNYNNNMGFALTFLLGGMGLVSIFHAYRNLAGLVLDADKVEPVFAGEPACFCLWADNRGQAARHALSLARYQGGEEKQCNFEADQRQRVCLEVPSQRRGRLPLGRLVLASRFPLGLFRAWSYLDLAAEALVYPHPSGDLPLPAGLPKSGGQGLRQSLRGDDFIGYRDYQLSDSPRHVDWKIVARDRGWYIKQFGGEGSASLWLTWEDVAHLHNQEAALSQLCRWVLQAESEDLAYGLRIPGAEIPPANGPQHRRHCLESLALFGESPGGGRVKLHGF